MISSQYDSSAQNDLTPLQRREAAKYGLTGRDLYLGALMSPLNESIDILEEEEDIAREEALQSTMLLGGAKLAMMENQKTKKTRQQIDQEDARAKIEEQQKEYAKAGREARMAEWIKKNPEQGTKVTNVSQGKKKNTASGFMKKGIAVAATTGFISMFFA